MMKQKYLKYKFDFEDSNFTSVYDELPLWSAPFGMVLLNTIKMRERMSVLDFGCGTGFPTIEIAQRLGKTSHVYGLDPWRLALDRIRMKIDVMEIMNVSVVNGVAEKMPFKKESFDLIVANNGINNVEDADAVLKECMRVSRQDSQMVVTVNLKETMSEFYRVFKDTLINHGKSLEIDIMREHISKKRMNLNEMQEKIRSVGFNIVKTVKDSFVMRFCDSLSMFNYFFIKSFFMEEWKNIISPNEREEFFTSLEEKLNTLSKERGEIRLLIPFACINCVKK